MPKISVWLTSYNHEKYIEKSIKSILNQSMQDFELIIVDDASSDNSWSIIKEYEKKDSRIRAIKHQINVGSSNFYESLHLIKSKFIAIAHSDDAWEKTKLEKQYKYMLKNPNIAACFTMVQLIDEDGNDFRNEKHFYYKMFEQQNRSRQEWLNYFFYSGNCLCHPSLLIKKDVLIKYRLSAVGLSSIPDFSKWVRLCCYEDIYIYPERLSYFRIRSNEANTSGDTAENQKRIRFEENILLDMLHINMQQDDFLKVFPQARKYIVAGEINYDYALAQILLEVKNRNTYHLYGLNLLYKLLNDASSVQQIERLYNYTARKFMTDTTKYDIFGFLKEEMFQRSTLYFDFGAGLNENDIITKSSYVADSGYFHVEYKINEIKNKEILGMRFDPDEGCFREYWDVKITIDDNSIEYTTNGRIEGDKIIFNTTDPNFYLNIKDNKFTNFVVEGYTRLYNPNNLSKDILKMECEKIEFLKEQRCLIEELKKIKKISIIIATLLICCILMIIYFIMN